MLKNEEQERRKNAIRKNIFDLIDDFLEVCKEDNTNDDKLALMSSPYGAEELIQAMDSLLSGFLTLNQFEKTKIYDFEKLWSDYINTKDTIMVNSGSSANFLALQVLSNPLVAGHIRPGDEIITPAVTWSTTVFPIINANAIPVFVDVDPQTLNISPTEIEKAISDKSKAIMVVHLLGNVSPLDEVMEICKKNKLFLIEDCCEAHGTEYKGKRVGSFGDISTFSFFFSHLITTIEGGAVSTSNKQYSEIARVLRSQGVVRNMKEKEEYMKSISYDKRYADIDEAYLFVNMGFNLRPTEIAGGFGIEQMKKIDKFISKRIDNARYLIQRLKRLEKFLMLPSFQENSKQSWLMFPFVVRPGLGIDRKDLTRYLNENGVENRPIMSGNMTLHPAMELFPYRPVGDLKVANLIHKNGFLVGNHQNVTQLMLDKLVRLFERYFNI
jgi:CDP-4-dehydro-6-deoxyglucose reductase, E1